MSETLQKNKLPILFILLVAGQALVYPLFVSLLVSTGSPLFIAGFIFDANILIFVLGMSAYIFTSIILCTINAIMGKIPIALPVAASILGLSGLMLLFVIQLIG